MLLRIHNNHHRGTEDTEGLSSINDPVDAASKYLYVEVDQESETAATELQVSEELRPVDREDLSNRLDLDNNRFVGHDIQPIPAV